MSIMIMTFYKKIDNDISGQCLYSFLGQISRIWQRNEHLFLCRWFLLWSLSVPLSGRICQTVHQTIGKVQRVIHFQLPIIKVKLGNSLQNRINEIKYKCTKTRVDCTGHLMICGGMIVYNMNYLIIFVFWLFDLQMARQRGAPVESLNLGGGLAACEEFHSIGLSSQTI